ncbi:2134_t:CDS:2, partial [Cetraspora pellucida]
TVDLLKKYTSAFYVFFNQAKEQAKPGFTFEPVDIIKELDNIIESNPKTEFEFMVSLRNTYKKLRDAHTQLFPSCYGAFLYDQQLHLYSIIKVFDDLIDPTNIDCEVTSIDSVPTFDAIKNFANNHSFISRDLGVRLNNALTSISLKDGKPAKIRCEFTVRVDIPETDSITYTLNCPNAKVKNVTREWFITFLAFDEGMKYFYKDVCLSSGNERAKHKRSHDVKKFENLPYIYHPKLKDVLSKRITKSSVTLILSNGDKMDVSETSSEELIGSKKIKRGGSQSSYFTKFILDNLPKQIELPWDTKNMIILSNGASGSAAGLIAQHLQEVGQTLSFASFPGGTYLDSDLITEFGIFDLPALNSHYVFFVMTFTFTETYSFKNPDTVLEFDFRPADRRLFYD